MCCAALCLATLLHAYQSGQPVHGAQSLPRTKQHHNNYHNLQLHHPSSCKPLYNCSILKQTAAQRLAPTTRLRKLLISKSKLL